MAIPTENAQQVIAAFDSPQMRNLFAQAQAKHVLLEVREEPSNFPAFDPALDEKVSVAAYSLLAAAASLIEHGERTEGINALERAASLLHYVHGPHAGTSARERIP
jgi:hypothetical protein